MTLTQFLIFVAGFWLGWFIGPPVIDGLIRIFQEIKNRILG